LRSTQSPPRKAAFDITRTSCMSVGKTNSLTARLTMKLFRSGIQELLRAQGAPARASITVGMRSRPAGFGATAANFQPALVRVARHGRLFSTTSRAAPAPFTFRNPLRLAAPSLLALALAACGGGGGGS